LIERVVVEPLTRRSASILKLVLAY